jgi:pyruvate/2-oxoglutarate/acetoin dehydrogenase E1 component
MAEEKPGLKLAEEKPELKFAEAIRSAIDAEMAADDAVVVMGEEVGPLGGVFTVTLGLQEKYGADRVLDSPICENGLVGFAIGAAAEGMRPVVEIMFSDFVLLALDQIVNLGAKIRFMSNGQFSVPLVIRMPGGGGTNHGPQHSQSLETIFAHVPGLVVALPSTAQDAYSMMRDAIRLDDPVIFLENKYLYFRQSGPIDEAAIGRGFGARIARDGSDVTVVSVGRMVHHCLEAAETLATEGISCEVVEWAADQCFDQLDAPILRIGSDRVPIPFGPQLEDRIVPTVLRVTDALRDLAAY